MATARLDIHELGPKGDGIHFAPRGRVFIERALPGDRLSVETRKDAMGVSRGEILEILAASPYRQNAPCVHYESCGNCTVQHLEPRYYRSWKNEMVKDALDKQHVRTRRWFETVYLGKQNRRRATFSVVKKANKIEMGYYRRRSQEVTDIETCLIAHPKLLEIRGVIKAAIEPFLSGKQNLDVFVQLIGDSIDVVMTGPVGAKGKPDQTVRAAAVQLVKKSEITRLSWRPDDRSGTMQLAMKNPVFGYFGPLRVAIPPASFMQPTKDGEAALVRAVMAALPAKGLFADLFSGCGTFTGPMLERGGVDAFEWVAPSVHALTAASRDFDLKVFRRDLIARPLRREEINRYDAIVFDPPRAGCEHLVSNIATSRVRTVIGVSCNPATFARDARILCDGGYRLESIQVVDQFLYSHHVEVVGVFKK